MKTRLSQAILPDKQDHLMRDQNDCSSSHKLKLIFGLEKTNATCDTYN